MTILMTFMVALKALRRNALRTSLTALGMIIGVAAVIIMVAIGTGARTSIEAQIRNAGSNIVSVNAGSGGYGPVRGGQGAAATLTDDDAAAIARSVPGIRYISPGINVRAQVVSEISNWSRMFERVAPSALRTPISRVRSVTDTSMMFMMPMPPTSSDTAAIPASR